MPYPIIPPSPISQDNPEILSAPAFGSTVTGIQMPLQALIPTLVGCNLIDGLADEDQQKLTYQIADCAAQVMDFQTVFDAGTRAAMRSALATELYGASAVADWGAIWYATNDAGGIPDWAPEGDYWALVAFGVNEMDMLAGENSLASSHWAWAMQVFNEAWVALVQAGVIEPTYTYLITTGNPGDAGVLSMELYGPEPDEAPDWQTNTADAIVSSIQARWTGGHFNLAPY